MNKYKQIDFFRGFAALAVFLSHYFAWIQIDHSAYILLKKIYESAMKIFQTPGEGHPGVVCFIVLSGFCIHLPYTRKKLNEIDGTKEIRKFFIRRFLRIFPLFILASLFGVFALQYCSTSPLGPSISMWSGSKISDITFSNIFQKITTLAAFNFSNYGSTYLGNAPLASVITEIWLYLCYPLFFYFLHKKSWSFLFIITILMYILFPIVYIIRGQEFWYGWWLFSIFNYYIIWTWGAFMAEVTFNKISISRKTIYIILFISGILYFVSLLGIHFLHFEWLKYLRMLLLSVLFGSILSVVIHPDYRLKWLKIPIFLRPIYNTMCHIGDFSYSLYAIHAPIIFISLAYVSNKHLNNIILLIIPLIVLSLSIVTYRLIEMPTHKFAKKLTK